MQELKRKPIKDYSNIVYDEDIKKSCSRLEWEDLMEALRKLNIKVKIHGSIYAYFLEVLPPIKMFDNGFYFREGYDITRKFYKEGNNYFCEVMMGVSKGDLKFQH